MPTALEFRETITPQFFADLLSCAAVSAGSETLQELVSGLSMPVGLRAPKFDANDAEDLDSTLAAVAAANSSRSFLGVTSHGIAGIVESTGNADTALLLDGGRGSATQRALRVLAACASQPSVAVIAECAGGGPHGPGAVVAEQTAMAAAITAAIAMGLRPRSARDQLVPAFRRDDRHGGGGVAHPRVEHDRALHGLARHRALYTGGCERSPRAPQADGWSGRGRGWQEAVALMIAVDRMWPIEGHGIGALCSSHRSWCRWAHACGMYVCKLQLLSAVRAHGTEQLPAAVRKASRTALSAASANARWKLLSTQSQKLHCAWPPVCAVTRGRPWGRVWPRARRAGLRAVPVRCGTCGPAPAPRLGAGQKWRREICETFDFKHLLHDLLETLSRQGRILSGNAKIIACYSCA